MSFKDKSLSIIHNSTWLNNLRDNSKVIIQINSSVVDAMFVMVGTSLRLTPATISYTWWVVYFLSSAAARGGAISANSQHCALHQPCTSYSFPLSYLFMSMPSLCVGMSFCVSSYLARRDLLNPCLPIPPSHPSSWCGRGEPVFPPNFLFCFWMFASEVSNKLHSSVLHST